MNQGHQRRRNNGRDKYVTQSYDNSGNFGHNFYKRYRNYGKSSNYGRNFNKQIKVTFTILVASCKVLITEIK